MKNISLALAFVLLSAVPSLAQVFPKNEGLVNDWTSETLTTVEKSKLEQRLRAYEKETTIEIAVVVTDSLRGMADRKELANKLLNQWRIGKLDDKNGLLILLSVGEQRGVTFEVGYGLEPYLTDGRTGSISRQVMLPFFRQGKWYEGLDAGISASIEYLRDYGKPTPKTVDNSAGILILVMLCVAWCVLGVIAIAINMGSTLPMEPEHKKRFRKTYPNTDSVSSRRSPRRSTERHEADIPVHVPFHNSGYDSEPSRPTYSAPDPEPSYSSPDPSPSTPDTSFDFGGGSSGGGGGGADF